MSRCRNIPSPISFPGASPSPGGGGGGALVVYEIDSASPYTVPADADVVICSVNGLYHYDLPPLASVDVGHIIQFKTTYTGGWIQVHANGTEKVEDSTSNFSYSPPWGKRIALSVIAGSTGWWVASQYIGQPPSQSSIPLETALPPSAWMLGTDADWPVTNVAALTADPTNAAIPVAELPASANTGIGFQLYTPYDGSYSLLWLRMMIKAVTPPGAPAVVKFGMKRRRIDIAGGPPAWSDYSMGDFTIPITSGFGRYNHFISAGSVGLGSINQTHQIQLYRNGVDVGDTLTGSSILIAGIGPRFQ